MTAAERADARGDTTVRSVSFLIFILRFTEPGGVTVPGAADRGAATERERAHLILDTGPGGVHLPGTSVAGALRAMIARARGPQAAKDLFGQLLETGSSAESVDSVPSRIWVLGCRRIGDGTEFRTSTKISRHRAAAEANTLRSEEMLPAGSRFEVFLRWDGAADSEVGAFAGLVAAWRPFIGRGTSRGRGACVAENVRYGTLRLDSPDGLLRWLTLSGPELASAVATTSASAQAAAGLEPVLRAGIELGGPFRVGNGAVPEPGSGEPIPLFRVAGKPVVPGSSLKGLLRARAEYILRSVGIEVCPEQRCGACWPCEVFGYGGGQDGSAESAGARAVLRIPDAEIRDWVTAKRAHVAIDRFTGGALDKALYVMEVLEAGRFELRVEPFDVIPARRLQEIRAVLRLVLADLGDGIIGMGGGVARGYGTVAVTGLDRGASLLPAVDEAQAELREMVVRGPVADR